MASFLFIKLDLQIHLDLWYDSFYICDCDLRLSSLYDTAKWNRVHIA